MKILVIGGGGQLGTKIIEQAKDRFDSYATYLTRKPSLDESRLFRIDKTNREDALTSFRELRQVAKRPMDRSLSVERIEKDLALKAPTVDEAMDRFSQQFFGAGSP